MSNSRVSSCIPSLPPTPLIPQFYTTSVMSGLFPSNNLSNNTNLNCSNSEVNYRSQHFYHLLFFILLMLYFTIYNKVNNAFLSPIPSCCCRGSFFFLYIYIYKKRANFPFLVFLNPYDLHNCTTFSGIIVSVLPVNSRFIVFI